MKQHVKKVAAALSLLALLAAACKGQNTGASDDSGSSPVPFHFDKDTSYAMGMDYASDFKENDILPDLNELFRGLKDGLRDKKTRFTLEEGKAKIRQALDAKWEKDFEKRKLTQEEFIAENSKKPGIIITDSGLQYEVISEGSGARPAPQDTVRVHYTGTLTDGHIFDSSYNRGEPAVFALNEVIRGWAEGIQLMRVGSKYKFYIPYELGYGKRGRGPIPPYSVLIYEVELLDIVE